MLNQSDSIAIKDIIHDTIPKFIGLVKPNADTLKVMLVPTDWKALWIQIFATGIITGVVSLAIAEYTVRKSKKHALEEFEMQENARKKDIMRSNIAKLERLLRVIEEAERRAKVGTPAFRETIDEDIFTMLDILLGEGVLSVFDYTTTKSSLNDAKQGGFDNARDSILQAFNYIHEKKLELKGKANATN